MKFQMHDKGCPRLVKGSKQVMEPKKAMTLKEVKLSVVGKNKKSL